MLLAENPQKKLSSKLLKSLSISGIKLHIKFLFASLKSIDKYIISGLQPDRRGVKEFLFKPFMHDIPIAAHTSLPVVIRAEPFRTRFQMHV